MALRATPLPMPEPKHEYYAEAGVLSAKLELPLEDVIQPRAHVKLPTDGHYQYKKAEPFRFEGILSYESGYTQVSGHKSSKGLGFTTLATSVLEGVNVLDVVTADRVVAQISTVHPFYLKDQAPSATQGQVPSVTFLGTRFENLRIGGHKVEVERSLDILGPRNDRDRSYFEDDDVLGRITDQYRKIAKADALPDWAASEYPKNRRALKGSASLECSVVSGVQGAPGTPFGHVIDLPHFGKIYLGELKVERELGNRKDEIADKYKFHLTMIRLEMGCLAKGTVRMAALDTNGTGGKGSGGGH